MTSEPRILDQPKIVPLPHEDWADSSLLSITIVEGPTLNLWSIAPAREGKAKGELQLQLQPDQTVVIGRQEGGADIIQHGSIEEAIVAGANDKTHIGARSHAGKSG